MDESLRKCTDICLIKSINLYARQPTYKREDDGMGLQGRAD
jgi:hypothetical protein